jgi:hypothetical protein
MLLYVSFENWGVGKMLVSGYRFDEEHLGNQLPLVRRTQLPVMESNPDSHPPVLTISLSET